MFESKTLAEHIARGAVGVGALTCAVAFAPHVWPAFILVPLGVWALRGCPMCWTMGLIETTVARLRGKSASQPCMDGSCALRR